MKRSDLRPRTRRLAPYACVLALTGIVSAGCADESAPRPDDDPVDTPLDRTRSGNLALSMDLQGDTDVAGFAMDVAPVDCTTGAPMTAPALTIGFVALEDMFVRDVATGLPGFDGGHLFADHFLVVEAGCYDVTATPMTAPGQPSVICASASARRVQVDDVWTTEIVLVSQCAGEDQGALDAASALNHAPQIDSLTWAPSKLAWVCEQVQICATAHDTDGDRLEFVWLQRNGPALFGTPQRIERTVAGHATTECVEVVGAGVGDYELQVWVRDMMRDQNGQLVPVQTVLRRTAPGATSEDDLVFPLHVRADDTLFCRDAATGVLRRPAGVRSPANAPGCAATGPDPEGEFPVCADEGIGPCRLWQPTSSATFLPTVAVAGRGYPYQSYVGGLGGVGVLTGDAFVALPGTGHLEVHTMWVADDGTLFFTATHPGASAPSQSCTTHADCGGVFVCDVDDAGTLGLQCANPVDVYRWDGATLTLGLRTGRGEITRIVGTSSSNVWVGIDGEVFHRDATQWRSLGIPDHDDCFTGDAGFASLSLAGTGSVVAGCERADDSTTWLLTDGGWTSLGLSLQQWRGPFDFGGCLTLEAIDSAFPAPRPDDKLVLPDGSVEDYDRVTGPDAAACGDPVVIYAQTPDELVRETSTGRTTLVPSLAVALPVRGEGDGLSSPMWSDGTRVTAVVELDAGGRGILECTFPSAP